MKEIWKDIKFTDLDGRHYDFTGIYQVSNLGNVRSLDRYVTFMFHGKKATRFHKGKDIIPRVTHNGYHRVGLQDERRKKKSFFVQRLVIFMFLGSPNIDLKFHPQVNHKDENKLNNRIDNLEWVTSKENCNYGTRNKRMIENLKGQKRTKEQIDRIRNAQLNRDNSNIKKGKDVYNARSIVGVSVEDGNVIEFECISDANEFFNKKGVSSAIGNQLRGKCNTSYGYKWYYKEEYLKIA